MYFYLGVQACGFAFVVLPGSRTFRTRFGSDGSLGRFFFSMRGVKQNEHERLQWVFVVQPKKNEFNGD